MPTPKSISIGDTVTLIINKEEVIYTICDEDTDTPSTQDINASSPLGSALLDKKEGDVFTLERNTGNLTVTVFDVQHPEE